MHRDAWAPSAARNSPAAALRKHAFERRAIGWLAVRGQHEFDGQVEQAGRTNYEVMLGDCLWHVYTMIGKLHRRAYALSRAA